MRFFFRRVLKILVIAVLLISFYPASAVTVEYSVQNWDEAPPVSEAKAPLAIDFWQVSPVVILAVMLTLISPVFILPAKIIIAGMGMLSLNFRRVEKKTVLDHELRGRIYDYIVRNPGVCFTEIEKNLSVNRGTLEYHLRTLRREHRIAVLIRKRRGFYFENSGRYSRDEMEMLAALRNDTDYIICEYLLQCPGSSRNDIASIIRTTCSTASWHMKRLSDSGVVFPSKEGRVVSYHLSCSAEKVLEDLRGEKAA
ncbi:MarR family transcriptional regulator [Methanoplanus limicola DSM 2279]|uniref:MarR family transcriptional regulator n=1 Tax=Methanoplanus limicola DSM 2279 TaxID=937775 RepID=H1Z2L1_9EURY|nr:MarR family transcriptional regulator [Methanoplanus limicola DSM 2279]